MSTLVLLSTYNGERFLLEQLRSLYAQTLPDIEVLARDDGSCDGTCAILEDWKRRKGLRWFAGMHVGAARSFWHLLHEANGADYYAFCDQDDVWDGDKLEIATTMLEAIEAENPGQPALYCSDVRVVDANLHPVKRHMVSGFPADYPHALVKNIAPGCTFVFNRAAREMLCRYDADALGIELHDWTAFQIISCFGHVIFDPETHLSYRQHGGNAIGAVSNPRLELGRKLRAFWDGPSRNSRERNAQRMEAAFKADMSVENRQVTEDIAWYQTQPDSKKRLLKSKRFAFPGNEGVLFKLLVALNRL